MPSTFRVFAVTLLRPALHRWAWLSGACAALLCIGGCQSPPDVRSFDVATSQLASAIKSTGRSVAGEVHDMASTWDAGQRAQAETIVTEFNNHWVERGRLADGLSAYSASLVEIVEAGERGEESAQALADSFSKLTDVLDISLATAAGEAAGAAAKVGTAIYGAYAKDRAARTLAAGMSEMQPYVEQVADLLANDLSHLEKGLITVRNYAAASVDQVDGPNNRKVGSERGRLGGHLERQAALVGMLHDTEESRDAARLSLAKTDPAALGSPEAAALLADVQRWTVLLEGIRSEMGSIDSMILAERELLKLYDDQIHEREARIDLAIMLVRAAREGLAAWADAHRSLADAASERRAPKTDELVRIAVDMRDLVQQLRTKKASR